jgi:hypothetical protein
MPERDASSLPAFSVDKASCELVRPASARGPARWMWRTLPLGVLGLGFCGLTLVAWTVSGRWVPEALVFGLSPVLVGLVRGLAGRPPGGPV